MDFSGLTFARRRIGQATLCASYEGMSVGARNIGAEKAQTWVPRNLARIKQGCRHGGNQSSDEKAEESTHFRWSYMEREETQRGSSSGSGRREATLGDFEGIADGEGV